VQDKNEIQEQKLEAWCILSKNINSQNNTKLPTHYFNM